ncbi:sushi, von Willebrand factor type A, EGF and pentraxin domain-containing protein 1-like isoform X2 [Ptychodera flava]|uniref:sushi, von Willebrand factor type A, EGF and pentraxin domain-containing protein 1-like isoform X2 n=1 Tax=Ptychodera flava TaxID=63121 RepID=UPI003969F889
MMRPPRGRLALWIFVLAAIKHASSSEADKFRRALRQDFLLGSEGQVDIVFLVDQSQSMSLVNGAVDTVFSFIKSLLVDFHIGKDYARVAVVTYSTTVSVSYNSIPDGDESVDLDKCQLFSEIDKIPREAKGWTATTDALRESRKILENSRPEAEKRIFLITDGPSDIGEKPTVASRELLSLVWNDNITSQLRIFAVGFGDAEYEELLSITSNESFAIHLNSFDEFRIFAVQFNTDKEENSWKTVEIDNCKSTCGDNAVCLCGLDIGVYQCVCDTGHQGSGADCEECPLGSYKSERTPEPCQPCPNGRTTYTVGATDVDHCVCPLGYSSDLRNGCRVTTCQALPVVEHSTSFHVSGIVLSETANTGQVCDNTVYNSCHFECNHGYRLVSSRAVTCLPFINGTGYWYGDLPACEEIQCPQVPDVGIGGIIQYSSGGPLQYPVGSTVIVICYRGFISYGDLSRTCTDAGIWDGTPTQCRAQECPALFSIKHTTVNPENCTTARHEIGTVCQYSCGDGFTMNGTGTSSYFTKTCLDHGEWTNHGLYGECVDFEPPEIVCPNDIHDTVDLNKATRLLHWDLHRPNATDNSGIVHLTLLSPYSSPYEFPVGTHSLTWQAEDEAGLSDRCSYNVVIQDRPPVVVFCPEDFTNKTSNSSGTHVDWPYPEYNDGHGNSIPASDITCLNGAYPGQFVSLGHHNIQCYPTGHPTVTCEFSFLLEAYDCTPPAPPLNGSRNCAAAPHSGYQQICTIFCHVESDFARTPADRNLYRCDYSGLWTCEGVDQCLPWPDCSKKYLSGTARVSSESYYFHDDCENSKDEIRRSFLEQYGPSNITCGDATDDFSCSVENVVVECGDFTSDRKRRESPQLKKIRSQRQNDWNVDHESLRPDDSDKPMRARRAVVGNTRVSFQINIVITSVVITENAQYDLYDLSIEVYYELEAVQQRGIDLVINNQVFAQSESSLSFQGVIAQCEIGQVERTYSGEAAECINCARGTFWESKSLCSPCARGFYQDEEKQTGCKACPDSKTTLIEGATDLEDCKDYCETGHWSDSGLEPCSPCNIGHYQDQEGRSFCHKCPYASTTTEAGSTARSSCISFCSPGTFSVNGLSPCQPCPRHHYQSAMRQTNCMECPGYRETVSMGTSSEGDCIFVDDCQSSPCQNGGLCRDMIGFYICICDDGFQGTDCEIDIDECQSNPCKNDAICVDQPNGYNCTCIPGFAGTNCDEDVDECLSSPCYRGTCINEVNGFQCVCPDDYHGDLCDKEQTLCVKCVHGYCNGTNCICDDGFTGDICDVEIDECASNPCQNEIMCHDEINKYRCQCKPSYTGPNCLTRKSMNFDLVFTGNMAEYVEVAASDLQIVDELSICLWLQTQDVDNYGTIFSYTTPNASVGLFDYRNLKFAAGNNVIQLNISVNDGVWHHLCVTWTHTEQGLAKLKICKDGICVRELNVPQLQTGGTLTVGQFKAIASGGFMQQRSFIGDMSRLHIYNSALSDQNIGQLAEKLTPCSLRYIHEDSLL